MQTYRKKLFKHGGSKAVDLPIEALKHGGNEVTIEIREDGIFIYLDELTNMESDARFQSFIDALFADAMNHPEKLKDLEEVWDEEWDELLRGIDGGDEL